MKSLTTIIFVAGITLLLPSCNDSKPTQLKSERQQERKERREVAKAKAAEGPYIESTKAISDAEEISILIVPDIDGHSSSDRRCLIYRHKIYKTSNMQCEGLISMDALPYDR